MALWAGVAPLAHVGAGYVASANTLFAHVITDVLFLAAECDISDETSPRFLPLQVAPLATLTEMRARELHATRSFPSDLELALRFAGIDRDFRVELSASAHPSSEWAERSQRLFESLKQDFVGNGELGRANPR